MKKPNIYQIKRKTQTLSPYFFSKDTLNFFNQKMSDFTIHKPPSEQREVSDD